MKITTTTDTNALPFTLPALFQHGEWKTTQEMHYSLHLPDGGHVDRNGLLITTWKIYWTEGAPIDQCYVEVHTEHRRIHAERFRDLDSRALVGYEIRQSPLGVQAARQIAEEIHGNYFANGWGFG